MSISTPLNTPFYQGGGISSDVPGLYPVAIDGHPFLIDMKSGQFVEQSIPLLRNQADTANLPGEQSINPEDLWRRSSETWHHGAGQIHFDRKDSDDARFRTSKGMDVWTKWQLTLLNDAQIKRSTSATTPYLMVAGARLYLADTNTLKYTTTVSTSDDFSSVTGTPASAITGIASDGVNVWVSYGANGLYHTTTALTVGTQRITDAVSGPIAYLKGRLLIADSNVLYNPTANTTVTTGSTTKLGASSGGVALFTHPNANFTWVGFAEGPGNIYAAGYAGDKSLVYRTPIRADGTALDIPVVAGELPDGEIVRSIQGYLGYILVGTDLGVRFATIDGNGNLTFGSLIRTGQPVRCFEPQDRFVWFGWPNYDGTSSGLGRLDLSVFTAPLTPAYASDLMVTGQANTWSVVTFGNVRVFSVAALGVYVETTTKVASGTLDTGYITYGIHDGKVPMFVDVRHLALVGTVSGYLANDDGGFNLLGTNSTAGTTVSKFTGSQSQASKMELRLVMTGVTPSTPTVQRFSLRASPAATSGSITMLPILLYESEEVGLIIRDRDVKAEYNFLKTIVTDHRLVTLQVGLDVSAIFIDDYEWHPDHLTKDAAFWNGTMLLKLKALASE